MQPNQIGKKLIIFFDPAKITDLDQWVFFENNDVARPVIERMLNEEKICVVHFNRRTLWRCVLLWVWLRLKKNFQIRFILNKNDGLLSSIFDAEHSEFYFKFRNAYLPESKGIKANFINYLPLSIQTDDSFLVITQSSVFKKVKDVVLDSELKALNFLFYSNVEGKLLYVDGNSFYSGSGVLAKTTTNQKYNSIMSREFETLKYIYELTDQCGITPEPIKCINYNNQEYYLEKFIAGRNLREIFRDKKVCSNTNHVCSLINQLDDWFRKFYKGSKVRPQPFQKLYLSLFESLKFVYADNLVLVSLIENNWNALLLLDQNHPGLSPILAHNDLWPGNFIMTHDNKLVAVDWERASLDRCELFDYFWMIISATMEYHVGIKGVQDYSAAFRSYLLEDDIVSSHARHMILSRLAYNNLPNCLLNLFNGLFLMEWSIQGWSVIGKHTYMDELAFGELIHYYNKVNNVELVQIYE